MPLNIISNLSNTDNHLSRIKSLLAQSDTLILASPFLMADFADFLAEADLSRIRNLHLITTLQSKSFDQIKKVNSLVSLIEFPAIRNNRIACQISINNKLHGKVYIFKIENTYSSAIVTSANFTDSGLSEKHEWGVELFDENILNSLEHSLTSCIEFPNIPFSNIFQMRERINEFLERFPNVEQRSIELDLTTLLSPTNCLTELDDTITYWLKPIGVSDQPVTEDRLFNLPEEELHFSKMRPTGVKPGDILIAYGVGTTKILTVYKAISFAERVTNEDINQIPRLERWPWYVRGTNLTQDFGNTWFNHNLFINSLRTEFLAQVPTGSITSIGGKTLGGLNFGKDKLKLSPEFARFIIDKVVSINQKATVRN